MRTTKQPLKPFHSSTAQLGQLRRKETRDKR